MASEVLVFSWVVMALAFYDVFVQMHLDIVIIGQGSFITDLALLARKAIFFAVSMVAACLAAILFALTY